MRACFLLLVAATAVAEPSPDLRQSAEPFRANPRFCGAIGNACERQPVPC